MVLCQSVINLRDSFYNNPPKATFLLCLLSLAFSFICLSYYTYTHILPNPDTTKDWNRLLSSLSQFQLCMKATASSELVAPTSSWVTSRYNSNTSPNAPVITLHLKVPLAVTANLHNDSLEGLGLQTTLRAEQLHLGGIELVNLTLQFSCGVDGYTCLTISAPVHILPIDMLPPDCPKYDKNISYIQVEASNKQPNAPQTCYSLNFKNDPTLTVMLTWQEQMVSVHHLLEVSVCLLGICCVLCVVSCMRFSLLHHYSWTRQDP
uniref:TMEM248/TMEM219 domain-containing protein n=1 Tax=Takifugu rubripes TaxID=31033 RepID=A0A3B5K945_TAKRU